MPFAGAGGAGAQYEKSGGAGGHLGESLGISGLGSRPGGRTWGKSGGRAEFSPVSGSGGKEQETGEGQQREEKQVTVVIIILININLFISISQLYQRPATLG